MVEAFSFLTANIREKLDDEFPVFYESLFNILYPHYNRPMPARSIVQIHSKLENEKVEHLPKHLHLTTGHANETGYRFSTVYPIDVAPISIENIAFKNMPVLRSDLSSQSIQSSLKINIKTSSDTILFKSLDLDNLCFYINLDSINANIFYELIFTQIHHIEITHPKTAQVIATLPFDSIEPVGFSENETLLPYLPHTPMGFQLINDFFAMPEKFLFFRLKLNKTILENIDQKLNVCFYFKNNAPTLEKQINTTSLLLHCTPIINLFTEQTQPINIDHTKHQYHLLPENRNDIAESEIYQINRCEIKTKDKIEMPIEPFFGLKHHKKDEDAYYWTVKREPAWVENRPDLNGDEYYISFSHSSKTILPQGLAITGSLLCFNRDAASHIAPGTNFELGKNEVEGLNAINKIEMITPMLPVIRQKNEPKDYWQLLSHLSLNHTTTTNVETLKDLLLLHHKTAQESLGNLIKSIEKIEQQPITSRHPNDARFGLCFGTNIQLTIDEKALTLPNGFLFGSILERFFSLYTELNSFTALTLISKQRGEIAKWKARM